MSHETIVGVTLVIRQNQNDVRRRRIDSGRRCREQEKWKQVGNDFHDVFHNEVSSEVRPVPAGRTIDRPVGTGPTVFARCVAKVELHLATPNRSRTRQSAGEA